MLGIPLGLKDCFFSYSNCNEWKRPSQETDIYVNIANWPAEINVVPLPLIRFSSQNCQMFHMHLCSGTGSTVMWILQRFFPDISPPPSCLAAYSVPTFSPTTSNTSRTKRLQGARCSLPATGRSWRKAALLTQVCSHQQHRGGAFVWTRDGVEYPLETCKFSLTTWWRGLFVPHFKNSVQEEAVSWTIYDILYSLSDIRRL